MFFNYVYRVQQCCNIYAPRLCKLQQYIFEREVHRIELINLGIYILFLYYKNLGITYLTIKSYTYVRRKLKIQF